MGEQTRLRVRRPQELAHGGTGIFLLAPCMREQLDGLDVGVAVDRAIRDGA
jgi:hypothetical protein